MKKIIRKTFCVCVLCMMIFFMGTSISTAENAEAEYTTTTGVQRGTFEEAISNVVDEGTVTLLSDVTIDSPMTVGKSFTLSGNNIYSIKRGAATGYMINIQSGMLTLKDIVVDGGSKDNKTATRAVFAVNGGEFVMSANSMIRNNENVETNGAGSAVTLISGTMTMDSGSVIENCNTPNGSGGGVALIQPGIKLIIDGGKIANCQSLRGGGIFINDGTVDYTAGIISDCSANYKESNYDRITASGAGDGIYVLNGTLRMSDDAVIDSCSADQSLGGGINIVNAAATLDMDGGTVQNCSALAGGGVFVNAGKADISGGILSGNSAATTSYSCGGGAIYALGGSTYISNATIKDNSAASYGGAICFNYYDPSIVINNCVFTNNQAKLGGAITGMTGDLTLTKTTIKSNHATLWCGGLFCAPDATVHLNEGVHIYNNTSDSTSAYDQTYKDVYLDGNEGMYDDPKLTAPTNPMVIKSALKEGSYIGISRWIVPDVNNPYRIVAVPGGDYTITEDDLSKFYSNDPRFIAIIHEGNIALTMRILMDELRVIPETLELWAGKHYYLQVIVTPDDSNEEIQWISSDDSIATVDDQGKVTAVAKGEAVITAKGKASGLEDTCIVTVKEEDILPPDDNNDPDGDETDDPKQEIDGDEDTGDETAVLMYLIIATVSVIAAVGCIFGRRKAYYRK